MIHEDNLEVVSAVEGAQVEGGRLLPLTLLKEQHIGQVLRKGDALRPAVGALQLQAAEPEPLLVPALRPALPAT